MKCLIFADKLNMLGPLFLQIPFIYTINKFLIVQLSQSTSLQSVIRNEVLPTVPMIISLGREFGIPLSLDDIHDPMMDGDAFSSFHQFVNGNNQLGFSNFSTDDRCGDKQQADRNREPLDMENEIFDKLIKARKSGQVETVDYINGNIVSKFTFDGTSRQRFNRLIF